MNETSRGKKSWRILRWILIGLAILATMVAIFYTEEDWRGKRAWENCKRELEAKGAVLDWDKYIPPPVPDDQNFFKASSDIALRFVKAQTEAQIEAASQLRWLRLGPSDPVVVAEVTVISANSNAVPDHVDLCLRYNHSVLAVGTSRNDFSEPQSPLLPLFDLKDVPLKRAIEQVARAAKLNYTIDPNVKSVDSKGKPIRVTIRWKNVTARQALLALLDNFDLVLIEDSKSGIARILPKEGRIHVESYAVKEINRVLSPVLDPDTNRFQGASLEGALGVWFFAKSSPSIKPAHIVVWANQIPSVQEMSDIFSKNTAKSTGTNSFSIYGNPRAVSAADYLAWSDQYEPAFDEVREALKRPYAIIPGDYSQPFLIPIPNFVTMRSMAQTLAQRAQCGFLLGQPDKALRELTLMHDLCRILEKPPTGKPETLVEAMINAAITGLYVNTIADGLQRHTWQEPQLAALQEQLRKINLSPFVAEGFNEERASVCFMLANTSQADYESRRLINESYGVSIKPKLEDPQYLFLTFAPRGWVYQNMVLNATQIQKGIECLDLANQLIFSRATDDWGKQIQSLSRWNPYFYLEAGFLPNLTKVVTTLAHTQTSVNEAQIACALERYRLVHGEYPESLGTLVPQFIEKLPHDVIGGQPSQGSGSASQPLHYRRTSDGKFMLYSVGWNETDDGGQPSPSGENGWIDFTKGDWVWKN